MSSIPKIRTHSAALLAVLQATPIPIGDGEMPDGVGWQGPPGQSIYRPYFILHSVPSGVPLDGTMEEPQDDLSGIWQLTAVGATKAQCEHVADIGRDALLTADLTVLDRFVSSIECEVVSGARRDDTVAPEPSVWMSTDLFRLATTPRP